MRIPRCTWSAKPRSAIHIGILRVILERSVLVRFPEGLQPIKRVFLNDAVVGIRRTRPAIPDDGARSGSVRGVRKRIPPEIIFAVINSECGPFRRDPLKAGEARSRVHHGRKDVGSRGVRPKNQFWSIRYQIVRSALAPKRIEQDQEVVEKFIVPSYRTTAAHNRVRRVKLLADWHDSRPCSRNQSDRFQMEMSASKCCVVSDFRNDVRKKIGSAYLGSIIKLRANRRDKCRWKSNEISCELVGVLNTDSKRQMIVSVIGHAELRSAGEGQANLEVLVLVVGGCHIGGQRTQPVTVGGQPAISLSAKNLPLAALQIHKAKAQTKSVAVHHLIHIGGVIAAEVRFAVAGHFIVADFVRDLYVEAGILRGDAILGQVALRSVAVWYRGEVGGDIVLGIGGTEYIFKVDESTGSKHGVANVEGSERLFILFCLFQGHWLTANICANRATREPRAGGNYGMHGCIHHPWCLLVPNRRRLLGFRSLPQRLNFPLLCSHLLLRLQESVAQSLDLGGKIRFVFRGVSLLCTTLCQRYAR